MLHHDVTQHLAQSVAAVHPCLDRSAVQDDTRREAGHAVGREAPAERDTPLPGRGVGRRYVLHAELHPAQFLGPASLQVLDDAEDLLVEDLRSTALGG